MIIDSHLHLTKEESEENFDNAKKRLLANFAENKISSAFVIADNLICTNCADTETLIKIFEKDQNIFIIGSPNVLNPRENEVKYFDDLLKNKTIIGLKLFPGHDPFYPTDPRCDAIYSLCLKYDVPVVIHTGINSGDFECAEYNDPKYIAEIANKYPDLKIVIAHYFWPKMQYCYGITKPYKNIYFDTSVMADDEVIELSGGIEKVVDILEKTIIDKPNNLLFGTDYPMCDTKKHIDLINNLKISHELKAMIFNVNAKKIFNIR
ncbi:MAG: amidohydrolase family protein [Patescibacteria group bacterium]